MPLKLLLLELAGALGTLAATNILTQNILGVSLLLFGIFVGKLL